MAEKEKFGLKIKSLKLSESFKSVARGVLEIFDEVYRGRGGGHNVLVGIGLSKGAVKKNCTNSHKKRKGGGSRDPSHCARSASAVTPSVADLRM